MPNLRTSKEERSALKAILVLGSVVLVLLAAGVFAGGVYFATGAFWPQAVPPRVQYHGREYDDCSTVNPISPEEESYVVRGHTIGGGAILAPDNNETPTTILIRNGSSMDECGLIGGP